MRILKEIVEIFGLRKDSLSYASFILFLGKLFHSLTSLIIFAILSRYFSKGDYGTYRQFWFFGFTLVQVFLFGIPSSVNYFVAGETQDRQRLFIKNSIVICFSLTFILGVLILIFRESFISLINNTQLSKFIVPLIILLIFSSPFHLYQPIFVSLKKNKVVVLISVVSSAALLLVVITTVALNASFSTFIYFLCSIMCITSVCILLIIILKAKLKTISIVWDMIKDQVYFSFPLGISLFFGLASKQLDKILVSNFTDSETFAIYSNGAFELPFIGIITNSVMAILLPEFVRLWKRNSKVSIINIWNNTIVKTGSIIIPMMVFFMSVNKEIIVLLFGEAYLASSLIFLIYLLILPMRLANFGSILIATGKTKVIFKYSILSFVMNLLLSITGYKFLNTAGIAIATVISIYFLNISQLYEVSKLLKVKIVRLIPTTSLDKVAFCSIIAVVISSLISFFISKLLLELILRFSLFLLIYYFLYEKIIAQNRISE